MSLTVVMTMFPGMTQLDLTGPFEVLSRLPGTEVHLAAKTPDAIRSDQGLSIHPTCTFDSAPGADLLFVPGGPGINEVIEDSETLEFVARQGQAAQYITSVCSGSLVLAAAGLLEGYRATSHWLALQFLPMFGAIPVSERVVIDRNRITGAGVTAGIDFALTVAAQLFGEEAAQETQLYLEYDPKPPFDAGSPRTAPPEMLQRTIRARNDFVETRRQRLEAVLATRRREQKWSVES